MTTQERLDALGMTRRGVARALGCSDATVGVWCERADAIPAPVAAWLDQCIATKPDWRAQRGRPAKPKGGANADP